VNIREEMRKDFQDKFFATQILHLWRG